MRREITRHSLPDRTVLVIENTDRLPRSHPAHGKTAVDGRTTAYVCRGTTCSLPVTETNRLSELLAEKP